MKQRLLLLIFGGLFSLGLVPQVSAATVTALTGTRNWSVGTDWDNGTGPLAADTVVIPAGSTMTMNVPGTVVARVRIEGGSLVWADNSSLTTAGGIWILSGSLDASVGNPNISVGTRVLQNGTLSAGTGTWTFTGTGQFLGGTAEFATLNFNTGANWTNSLTGELRGSDFNGPGTLTQGAGAYLRIYDDLSANFVLNAAASGNTVNYNGTDAHANFEITTYHHLILENSAGIAVSALDMVGSTTLLTVNGNLTVGGSRLRVNNMTVNGTTTINADAELRVGATSVTSQVTFVGDLTCNGIFICNNNTPGVNLFVNNVTVNSGGSWDMNQPNPEVYITGNVTVNAGGTFTANSPNYNFTGGACQILGTGTFSIQSINITGLLTTNNSGFSVTNAITGPGTFAIGAGQTFNWSAATLTNLTVATFDPSAANTTVNYNRSGTQEVRSATYFNLSISGNNVKTLQGNVTVNNNLSIAGSATLATGEYSITGNATGLLTMGAGTTLSLGSNSKTAAVTFPSGYTAGNISLNATSLVSYDADADQTVSNVPTYGGLTFTTGATPRNRTLAGAVSSTGTVTVGANITVVMGANNLSQTSLTNNGTITSSGGSILMSGGAFVNNSTITLTSGNFTNTGATLNNAGTLTQTAGNFTSTTNYSGAGTLTLGTGGTHSFPGSAQTGTINVNGTLSLSGNYSGTGTINVGTATLTIGGTTSNGAIIATSGTLNLGTTTGGVISFTGAGTINTAATFTPSGFTAGTSTINVSGTGNITFGDFTYYNLVNIKTNNTLDFASGTITFNDLTLNGTGSTIRFNNTDNVSVLGTTTITAGTLSIDDAGVTYITNNFTQTGGTFDNNNLTGTTGDPWTITGNLTRNGGTFTNPISGVITLSGTSRQISGTLAPAGYSALEITGSYTNLSHIRVTRLTGSGSLTQGTGAILEFQGSTLSADFTLATINFSANPNTVEYNLGGNQEVRATTYHSAGFSTNGTKTMVGNITVNANLTITGSIILITNQFSITGTASGLLSMTGTSQLRLGNTAVATAVEFPANFTKANISLASGTFVVYQSNTSQNISSVPDYANLSVAFNAGTTTKSVTGSVLNVNGNLTVNTPNTLDQGAATINVTAILQGSGRLTGGTATTVNVGGNVSISNVTPNTMTLVLNGTGAQSMTNATTWHNITVNKSAGTATISANLTLNNLTLDAGTTTIGANSLTGTGKLWIKNGTTFTKSSATGAISFVDLEVETTGNYNFTANPVTSYSGDLIINGIFTSGTGAYTLSGTSKSITGATNPITFAGSLTVNGTRTNSATIAVTGASNVSAGATFTNNATATLSGTLTLAATGTVANSGTILSNAAFDCDGTLNNNGYFNSTGRTNGSGTVNNLATGYYYVNHTVANFGVSTFSSNTIGNVVEFGLNGAQGVRSGTYWTIKLSNAGNKPLQGALTVLNSMYVEGLAILDQNINSVVINDSLVVNSNANHVHNAILNVAHLVLNTGTFGSSSTINVSSTFENNGATFNATGTVVATGTVSVKGSSITTFRNVTISTGATLLGHPTEMIVTGNWTNNANTSAFNGNSALVTFANGAATTITGTTNFFGVRLLNNNASPANNSTVTVASGTEAIVNGTFTLDGTASTIVSGVGKFSAKGNINLPGSGTSGGGTGTVEVNGTGAQTITGNATPGTARLPIFIINKPSGTVNLASNISLGNGLVYTAGTMDPGTSTLVFNGSGAISGAFTAFNAQFLNNSAATMTYTVTGTGTVNGTLSKVGADATAIDGSTMNLTGNIDLSAHSSTAGGGTTVFFINGTGAQSLTGTAVAGQGRINAFNINKASGTLSLSGFITCAGNVTYTAGTLNAGTSTLVFNNSLNISMLVGTPVLFNNIQFLNNTGAAHTYVLVGLPGATGTLSFVSTATSPISLSGSEIVAQGNIDLSGHLSTANPGSTTVRISGTAVQTLTGSGTVGAGRINTVRINKTGGSLTLASTITLGEDFFLNSGTLNSGTSTVAIVNSDSLGGTISFNNLTFSVGGTTTHEVTTGNVTVTGTLTYQGAGAPQLNGNKWFVRGNWNINNTGTAAGGSAIVEIAGNANQTVTSTVSAGQGRLPNIEINKTNPGTLTWIGDFTLPATWTYTNPASSIMTSTAATFYLQGNTLITGSQHNILSNVVLDGTGAARTFELSGTPALVVSGNLTTQGGNNINWLTGTVNITGNLTINNTSTVGNTVTATLNFTGTTASNITSSLSAENQGYLPNIAYNKTGGGSVSLSGSVNVLGTNYTTNSGTINYGTSTVGMRNSKTISGAASFYNLIFGNFSGAAHTVTLSSTVASTNEVQINGTHSLTFNTNGVNVQGNMVLNNTSNAGGGTGIFTFNGTGSQTLTSNVLAGQCRLPRVAVNKASGTLSWAGNITVAGTALTYTAGTLAPGTSTLHIATNGTCTVTGAWTFNNLDVLVTANNVIVSLGAPVTVNNTLSVTGGNTATLNNQTYNVLGNVDFTGNTAAGNTGSSTIVMNGTGAQNVVSDLTSTTTGRIPNLSINKASGTLTLGAQVNLVGSTFTYTAGTIDATGSTVNILSGLSLNTGTGSSAFPFNNLSIRANATISGDMFVNGNLLQVTGTTLNTGTNRLVRVRGNHTLQGSAAITLNSPGTAFIYDGTSDQTLTLPASRTFARMWIDKSASVLNVTGAVAIIRDTIQMRSGNVDLGGTAFQVGTGSTAASVGYLKHTSGYFRNGSLRRYLVTGAPTSGQAGLFPMGVNPYRPLQLSTTANPTVAGYLEVAHNDAVLDDFIQRTKNPLVDNTNGTQNIRRIMNLDWTITRSSGTALNGATFTVEAGFTPTNPEGFVEHLVMTRLVAGVPSVAPGTHATGTGSMAGIAYARRTGVTTANLITSLAVGTAFWTITPLPVTLMSFTGRRAGAHAELTWLTASESNNYGFFVEKSLDGKTFETIGFVEGKGTSKETQRYTFTDTKFSATAYYRLKQRDFDGAEEHSKALRIKSLEDELTGGKDGGLSFEVFPNPFTERVLVRTVGESNPQETFRVQVYGTDGRRLGNWDASLDQVNENLNATLQGKPAGQYMIVIYGEEQKYEFRLNKQ